MLSFALLGQAEVCVNNVPVEHFRSQKEAALLFYLAHTGRSHSRLFMAELLWEGRTSTQALSNLRTALSRLRDQVGDELEVTRSSLALASGSLQQVDSADLLQALTEIGSIDSAEKAERLQQVLRSYRGDFLADFYLSDAPEFEEWVDLTREQIRRQVMVAHHKLTSYLLETGGVDQGIAAARQWVQVDTLNEIAHMTLIRLLLQKGNLLEAKTQYAACVQLLRIHLDMEPPPELTALIQNASPRTPIVVHAPTLTRHNLPAPYDQFFGRVNAQREIHNCLDQPWCRLVTISGQGGVGKTRLATTIARNRVEHYQDGVWLVNLADVDPDDDNLAEAIAVEIASVLQLRLNGSVSPIKQLLDYLQHKQYLLVLDNLEHLLEGIQIVSDILQHCERIQILVTSREILRVRAEWTIELVGLPYPVDDRDERPSDAVSLFVARRAQHRRGALDPERLAAVRTICRMVEGLPLAIELAAALTREMTIPQIARRLQTGLGDLSASLRDLPDRHRNLGVVFETSWSTLTTSLQQRLAGLSIFQGGFDMEAAAQVADAYPQHLAALSGKSLLIGPDPRGRHTLHPVVQAHAAERLSPTDQVPRKHAQFYLNLLAAHTDPLQKENPQLSVAFIVPEMENVRLAWQHCLVNREFDLLASALTSLSIVYQLQGLTREAESVMQATANAAAAWGDVGLHLAARASLEQTRFQNRLGHPLLAAQTVQTALKLGQALDDPWVEAMGHVWWGEALWRVSEYDLARSKLAHALAIGQRLDSVSIVGWCHHQMGIVDDIQSRYDSAYDHLVQACAAWRALGNARVLGASLNSLGLVHYNRGDLGAAQETLEEALAVCTQIDNRHLQTILLNNLSNIAAEQDDYVGVQYFLQAGLTLATANGDLFSQADMHMNLALNYSRLKRYDQAAEHVALGMQIAEATGNRVIKATAISRSATLARAKDDIPLAESLYLQALSMVREDGVQRLACDILICLAELLSREEPEKARRYSAEALALAKALQNPKFIDRAQAIDHYLRVSMDAG